MKDEYIEIASGSAEGRYRIFGLDYNFALTRSEQLGVELHLNLESAVLEIYDVNSRRILQELGFTVFSGDWAYASFSDDYSTIAVLEPYNITVFRQ